MGLTAVISMQLAHLVRSWHNRGQSISLLLLLCLLSVMPWQARAQQPTQTLTIACSANFSAAMDKLVALFKSQQPQQFDIRIATGSSGTLATQVRHGAPYDLFFSADSDFPARLMQQGAGLQTARYARGVLVLYSNAKQPIDLHSWLNRQQPMTLAIANPKHAPYGKAAVQVLERLNNNKLRLVSGTSVLHAFQYAESGHADFALIAESLLQQPHQGEFLSLPQSWYTPIEQHVLLISPSAQARAFFDFVQSKPAQQLIQTLGYK